MAATPELGLNPLCTAFGWLVSCTMLCALAIMLSEIADVLHDLLLLAKVQGLDKAGRDVETDDGV